VTSLFRWGSSFGPRALRPVSVALLLALSLFLQLNFFETYPQPTLFGDPVGYMKVGQTLRSAASSWLAGRPLANVFANVRGALHFVGVGTLYAILDAIKPGNIGFIRVVFALFNTLGVLGCFLLARRLSSFLGGVVALAFAALHPSFPTATGRLYPDPVTGCLFVWAAFLYVKGVREGSQRSMAAAGFALTLGLFVRSQLMSYVLGLLALAFVVSSPLWLSRKTGRRMATALALGCLPLALLWSFVLHSVSSGISAKVAEDNFALKQHYPYGFWQFLETDGWEGPYRLKTEPFYKALESASHDNPELLRSRPLQLLFTLRYVAARPLQSALLVLDNVYRLYDRPANPYRWDYPFPIPYQVALQRLILIFALGALGVFLSEAPAQAGVFFVPASLAIVHGLAFPWPRYGLPALLTLTGLAGALVGWVVARLQYQPLSRTAALVIGRTLGAGLALLLLKRTVFGFLPELGHVAGWLALPFLTLVPFLTPRLLARGALWPALLVWGALTAVISAHAIRDSSWHHVGVALTADVVGVEQEISLSPEALGRLRSASEAFVVFDLEIPRGDCGGIALEVNRQNLPGWRLLPTMPRLREATETGGRDWRGYPQWWALPLTPDLLPAGGEPFRVKLLNDATRSTIVLGGDRFSGQERRYQGPSFGDWPHLVAGKLEYDGDYRLPVTRSLGSYATRSFLLGGPTHRQPFSGVHRIRIVTLANNEGSISWESAPPPRVSQIAFGFGAYSGNRGRADLVVQDRTLLSFPLGAREDFDLRADVFWLCHRAEPSGYNPYGSYFLIGPPDASGKPMELCVRFRTGMSAEPMFFVIDQHKGRDSLARQLERCDPAPRTALVAGTVRDASRNNYPEDTGRWSVAAVF